MTARIANAIVPIRVTPNAAPLICLQAGATFEVPTKSD
jgi:hypothetical protein